MRGKRPALVVSAILAASVLSMTVLASDATPTPQEDGERIRNGDFENYENGRRRLSPDKLKTPAGQRLKDVPVGFGIWSYTGRPARFVWADKLSHGGKRCIGIEANEGRACFIHHLKVKPGQRYRVSVFATSVWQAEEKGGDPYLQIAWKTRNEKGLLVWSSAPRATVSEPIPKNGEWRKLVVRVTVPEEVQGMVILLGTNAARLGQGGCYFDDLSAVKIYEPSEA